MHCIYYEDKPCGTAKIEKTGLYYTIVCNCQMPDSEIYRILLKNGKEIVDLGICIPYQGSFGIRKKLPVKKINDSELSFELVKCREKQPGLWIELECDKPFPYLSKLEKTVLHREENRVYAFIQE